MNYSLTEIEIMKTAPAQTANMPASSTLVSLPAIITASGPTAPERFLEFFAANIRNPNTRRAYARQVMQFLTWCEGRSVTSLCDVRPLHVASYIETMPAQAQTVKQALAAIRMLFDWLVIGQIVPTNPAGSVRGPKYSYRKGKTPVLGFCSRNGKNRVLPHFR